MKRFPAYSSTSARLSQKIGAVAVPVSILAVLANRAALIDPPEMIYSVLAGAILGLAALALALAALYRLWVLGGFGTSRAGQGTFYGLLALTPLVLFAGHGFLSPGMADISTDWRDPPEFKVARPANDEGASGLLTTLFALPGKDRQRELFPDIVPRRYRISPGQLHAAALEAAQRNGWDISYELPPDLLDSPTALQFADHTPFIGLPEDLVLRTRPDPVGSLLDVRSASRFPVRGLTGNAARIRSLFDNIDEVLLETYGEIEHIDVTDVEQGGTDVVSEGVLDSVPPANEVEKIPVPPFKPYFPDEDTTPLDADPGDVTPADT